MFINSSSQNVNGFFKDFSPFLYFERLCLAGQIGEVDMYGTVRTQTDHWKDDLLCWIKALSWFLNIFKHAESKVLQYYVQYGKTVVMSVD